MTTNPEENLINYDWMHSLSRTNVIEKRPTHGARHCKTEVQKSTTSLAMRGRDVARKLTLMVVFLKSISVIHDRFLGDPVNRDSQLVIRHKSAKRWTNLSKKITRFITLQRNSEDTKDNGISP